MSNSINQQHEKLFKRQQKFSENLTKKFKDKGTKGKKHKDIDISTI